MLRTRKMQKSSLIKNVKSHETVCKRLLSEYKKHKKNLTDIRRNYLERRVIVPMCNMQYMIAVEWCKSKADFLSFISEIVEYFADFNFLTSSIEKWFLNKDPKELKDVEKTELLLKRLVKKINMMILLN